jgi:hypothetical protein
MDSKQINKILEELLEEKEQKIIQDDREFREKYRKEQEQKQKERKQRELLCQKLMDDFQVLLKERSVKKLFKKSLSCPGFTKYMDSGDVICKHFTLALLRVPSELL